MLRKLDEQLDQVQLLGSVPMINLSWPQKSEQPDKWSLCCPGA